MLFVGTILEAPTCFLFDVWLGVFFLVSGWRRTFGNLALGCFFTVCLPVFYSAVRSQVRGLRVLVALLAVFVAPHYGFGLRLGGARLGTCHSVRLGGRSALAAFWVPLRSNVARGL